MGLSPDALLVSKLSHHHWDYVSLFTAVGKSKVLRFLQLNRVDYCLHYQSRGIQNPELNPGQLFETHQQRSVAQPNNDATDYWRCFY